MNRLADGSEDERLETKTDSGHWTLNTPLTQNQKDASNQWISSVFSPLSWFHRPLIDERTFCFVLFFFVWISSLSGQWLRLGVKEGISDNHNDDDSSISSSSSDMNNNSNSNDNNSNSNDGKNNNSNDDNNNNNSNDDNNNSNDDNNSNWD